MKNFDDNFINNIAKKLLALIEEAEKSKPFAAILFSVDKGKRVEKFGKIVVSAYNTEISSGNPNAHAEINVINMASKKLSDAIFDGEGKEDFYLFVSTRPCPKCTAAIVDAQIFNVYFLFDNEYKKSISEMIISAKEKDLGTKFTFSEISSTWKQKFKDLLS